MSDLYTEIKLVKKLTKKFFEKYKDEINILFPDIIDFKEKLYLIRNNIISIPKCSCGKNRIFKNQTKGYLKTCGDIRCIKTTTTTSKSKTMIERYGVEFALQNENIKKKTKKTNLEKYGVSCTLQNQKIKEKIKLINIEKYGDYNIFKTDNFKNKSKKTILEKYKTDNVSKNNEIKKKKRNTFQKKYNVNNILNDINIRKQISETIRLKTINNLNILLKNQNKEILTYNNNCIVKCYKCNNEYNISKSHLYTLLRLKIDTCRTCNPKLNSRSTTENELYEFCKNEYSYLEIIPNYNKLKYEIDIFFPELNFGIEYNGLYWHSEIYRDKNYHQDKLEYFEKQNINILQVWEDDWNFKQEIIKNIIRSKINPVRIYGRKCILKEINSNDSKIFHNQYHLDGYSISKIHIGLFYNDELISLCSFGKSRFNKKYEYELTRYTTMNNYSIIGGFSKMLNYFEKTYKPNSIISYKKLDLGYKNFYEQVGFKKEKRLQPNYYWVVNKKRENRIKYQRHKLENILPEQSEIDYMYEKGYYRCFDCGSDVFLKIN